MTLKRYFRHILYKVSRGLPTQRTSIFLFGGTKRVCAKSQNYNKELNRNLTLSIVMSRTFWSVFCQFDGWKVFFAFVIAFWTCNGQLSLLSNAMPKTFMLALLVSIVLLTSMADRVWSFLWNKHSSVFSYLLLDMIAITIWL